ncbi:MAG: hypothetical protein Q7J16_04310 [Candidatus Cloacimonadales bacterium]|nr:hypothetical protein [Candidatus Cloacimonadales bacterium]
MKYIKFGFLLAVLIALILSCSETTAPELGDVPTNLEIEVISVNNIRLTWLYNNVSGDTITFHIARKVGAGDWNESFDEVDEDTFEYIDDNINTASNSVYAYKIRYYNKSENSFSNYSEAVAYFSDFTTPTDLVIIQNSQSALTLSWTDNCIGEEGYRIDKKIGDGNWNTKYLELPENTISVTDNVALFDTLYYRIYVFSGKSTSNSIQDTIFQTLSAPSDLSTYLLDDNKIRLNWIDNSNQEDGFYIDRKVGGLAWITEYDSVDSNVTTYIDDILYPCGTMVYRVRAYYDQFTSNYCAADTINVNLSIVGELTTNGSALEVSMSGWNAFVADNYFGLAVIDCFNPNNPLLITSYNLADRTLSSSIVQNFAYVATHSGINTPGVVQKIDITVLEEPVLVDFTNVPGIPKDICVDGDYAYIAGGEDGLSIVYIAGSNLFTLSNYPMNDARHVCIEGSFAFVADGLNGMKIINVLDPQNPVLISQITTSGITNDVCVSGNYAFLADGENGLKILNISNIYYPYIITTLNTGGFVYGVYAEDNYVYVADKEKGFYVVDYSAIYTAFILGHIELNTEPISAFLNGSYVYITDNEGLKIIQVKP